MLLGMDPDLVVQNGGLTNVPLEPLSRVEALVVTFAKTTFEKGWSSFFVSCTADEPTVFLLTIP